MLKRGMYHGIIKQRQQEMLTSKGNAMHCKLTIHHSSCCIARHKLSVVSLVPDAINNIINASPEPDATE